MGMKVIYACLAVLFLITLPVFAQNQPPSADEIVAKMQSELNLTQDQVSAITPIIEKYASKREQLHQGLEDGTIEKSDMRSQMKELKQDEADDLSQVLSTDQMGEWKAMLGQMRKHEGGGPGEGGGNGGEDNPPAQQ